MALVPCPECEKQVSTAAEACPHCGYPISKMKVDAAAPVETAASKGSAIDDDAAAPVETAASKGSAIDDLYAAANRAQWRTLGLGVLVLSVIGLVLYGYLQLEEARRPLVESNHERELREKWERQQAYDKREQAAAYEKYEHEQTARAVPGYYCFSINSTHHESSPCFMGLWECRGQRRTALDVRTGSTISECSWTERVFRFSFACGGSTCYEARDTYQDCAQSLSEHEGKANNLTGCELWPGTEPLTPN